MPEPINEEDRRKLLGHLAAVRREVDVVVELLSRAGRQQLCKRICRQANVLEQTITAASNGDLD